MQRGRWERVLALQTSSVLQTDLGEGRPSRLLWAARAHVDSLLQAINNLCVLHVGGEVRALKAAASSHMCQEIRCSWGDDVVGQ